MFDESSLQRYILDQIQESSTLDYKAAGSLDRADKKKEEITKDVSAIANSAGGILIYGIAEFNQLDKRHLPERIDPINRPSYSREWLEQVINNIKPRISGIVIHSVQLHSGANDVAYVVEIPQSNTAHQATDLRYYRRYNFQAVAMEDYEIRDVINRRSHPDVSIDFSIYEGVFLDNSASEHVYYRGMKVILKNNSNIIINRYKAELALTNTGWADEGDPYAFALELINLSVDKDSDLKVYRKSHGNRVNTMIIYQPSTVLFPGEEIDIGGIIPYGYPDKEEGLSEAKWKEYAEEMEWEIEWKIYADSMPCKAGKVNVAAL